ncbi:histidine phosphatase family protein [Shewanella canadensis]|uniref:Histidine phosphatase family protein n=1 Tax=Shewanella canadensis TaxID=271096 RepID=A0A3S0IMD7_9GAMM|nr:histidine phosphatase family protein [Shewanella canadensis]RTR37569.1 histidine phosphatase family protein [Shewanella canadensis]
MKILFCRHGETQWNKQGKLQGHLDSHLTLEGQCQARRLGTQLASHHPDLIFTSDLGRAMTTATLANHNLNLPIESSPLLRERCFGELQGLHNSESLGLWEAYERRFVGNEMEIEGAESATDVLSRVQHFLRGLSNIDVKTLVVIGHGEWLRVIQNLFAGEQAWSNRQLLPGNCEIIEFNLQNFQLDALI